MAKNPGWNFLPRQVAGGATGDETDSDRLELFVRRALHTLHLVGEGGAVLGIALAVACASPPRCRHLAVAGVFTVSISSSAARLAVHMAVQDSAGLGDKVNSVEQLLRKAGGGKQQSGWTEGKPMPRSRRGATMIGAARDTLVAIPIATVAGYC